jgi:hypothetical protein
VAQTVPSVTVLRVVLACAGRGAVARRDAGVTVPWLGLTVTVPTEYCAMLRHPLVTHRREFESRTSYFAAQQFTAAQQCCSRVCLQPHQEGPAHGGHGDPRTVMYRCLGTETWYSYNLDVQASTSRAE